MYVTTVVAGLIAINFEPEATPANLGRDVTFYIIALGWVIAALYDGKMEIWETVMFLVLYVVYVLFVVVLDLGRASYVVYGLHILT